MKRDILDHVAICTDSIEKSVIWYTENFKCDILYQDETWAMLEFENVKLALVLPDQ
ncbi:MAG: glyoxalase, partial [Candidatus Marinimicrobia bacterium]|nr:glyoxalase [Candidatus Neomarinimicrobiota bacterium]